MDALQVSPDDDFIFYLRQGTELLEEGRAREARLALETAHQLRPDSPRARNLLGLTYFKLGLLEAARMLYEGLVTEHPRDVPLKVNLGLVLLKQGRVEEAEASLRGGVELAPDHARAHSYLGLLLYRRGDLEEAYDHFVRGGSTDLAERVRQKLEAGQPEPSRAEVLDNIADEGIARLSGDEGLLVVDAEAPAPVRDEDAWEIRVSHAPDTPAVSDLDLPAPASAAEPSPLPAERKPQPLLPSYAPDAVEEPYRPEPKSWNEQPWARGFTAPRGSISDAYLCVEGVAHLRGSTLVAAEGSLAIGPSSLESTANPFLLLEGNGRCLVRVPHRVTVVRDIRRAFVRSATLAGFEGPLEAQRGEIAGSSIIELSGVGSMILNTPRRALRVTVTADNPLHARRDAVLAWMGEVDLTTVEVGLPDGMLQFRGEGSVFVAGADS